MLVLRQIVGRKLAQRHSSTIIVDFKCAFTCHSISLEENRWMSQDRVDPENE